ncbi:MAG: hypothetical protein RL026_402 [Pseudomonadota bacterium]|jgi:hypothetical protein
MSEKPESDDFDETDVDELDSGGDDFDLDRVNKDLELARKRGPKQGEPAWRKLELLKEQKRMAELTSDFEDYDLGDDDAPARGRGARRP